MTQLYARQVALAKSETTYGVDSSPTNTANAFLVQNLTIDQEIKMNARKAIKSTVADLQSVPGPSMAKIMFEVEMKGSGTAGTAPECDPLLQACGMSSTVVASTSVTYAPQSSGYKSCTIYVYQDGSLFKCTGALGTYTIDIKAGTIPFFKFEFDCLIESHTDTALVTPTLSTVVPPAAIDSAVLIGGTYTPIMTAYTYNAGCKVDLPEAVSTTSGYAPFIITNRQGKGTLAVEMDLVGNFDYYGIFQAGTDKTFSLPLGSVAGNKIAISHPKMYIESVKQGNANGILTLNVGFGAVETTLTSDDEVQIQFT